MLSSIIGKEHFLSEKFSKKNDTYKCRENNRQKYKKEKQEQKQPARLFFRSALDKPFYRGREKPCQCLTIVTQESREQLRKPSKCGSTINCSVSQQSMFHRKQNGVLLKKKEFKRKQND